MQPNSCSVSKIKGGMSNTTASNSRDELSPEVLGIVKSALQVGALSGTLSASHCLWLHCKLKLEVLDLILFTSIQLADI